MQSCLDALPLSCNLDLNSSCLDFQPPAFLTWLVKQHPVFHSHLHLVSMYKYQEGRKIPVDTDPETRYFITL